MVLVTSAMNCSRRGKTRVFVDVKPVEIEINGTAMKRLQFGGWLQDDHINGYMYLLNRAGPVKRLLAFSSFFMVKLMNDSRAKPFVLGTRLRTSSIAIKGIHPKQKAAALLAVGVLVDLNVVEL